MFERRLKIFLAIVFAIASILLLRAMQLQILSRSHWQAQEKEFGKRSQLVETTRGRILDRNGEEIAADAACMDACVDFRAIRRDPKWIESIALQRVKLNFWDSFRAANDASRKKLLADAIVKVNSDIDAMWRALGLESDQTPDQIEEIRQSIEQRVAMRTRYAQYWRFKSAADAHQGRGPDPWYRRWLASGDGPDVDDFAIEVGEQTQAHPILRNISQDTFARLAKQLDTFPGLQLKHGTHRIYPFGRAGCHVIGQLVSVTISDIENDPSAGVDDKRAYLRNDALGRGGLEGFREPTLRGTRGKIHRVLGHSDEIVDEAGAVAGGDVQSTIDIRLQTEIQNLFKQAKVASNKNTSAPPPLVVEMHGAAVVIDVATAQVLALASYPDYDPNELQKQYLNVTDDLLKLNAPLMNRATQSQLEPGSTIKPVVGLGAITQGIISCTQGIECTGYLVIKGKKYPNGRCWVASKYANDPRLGGNVAHHPIPSDAPHRGRYGNPDGFLCFADALERSCNVYFENLADRLELDGLSYWFDKFGLGRETGIGISEARGQLPNSFRGQGFQPRSVIWFSGIGQTQVLATPIQMANVAATIARDGIWMRPRLVSDGVTTAAVRTKDGREIPDRVDLKLSPEALAAAKEGMTNVVNGKAGTGADVHMDEVLVAGKTGTAQAHALRLPERDEATGELLYEKGKPDEKPKLKTKALEPATIDRNTPTPWYRGWGEDGTHLDHAWFIGFAPADKPQIAFAVMVEFGGPGGKTAGLIAKDVLAACIRHNYLRVRVGVAQ